MYSAYYYYFEIRGRDDYSLYTKSEPLVAYLVDELGLIRESEDSFVGKNGDPHIDLSLVCASNNGSYSTKDVLSEFINLVVVIGSRESSSQEVYLGLLTKIAKKLNWCLIDEEDDELVWKPK